MNLTLRLLLASLLLALTARAEDASFTVTPTYVSQYMFRGARLDGPSLQPTVEFDSGNLALGLFASTPLQRHSLTSSTLETDLYGSYAIELVKDRLTLTPGFTLYGYPHAADGAYHRTFEPSLALAYSIGDLTLTPKAYYDTVLHGATAEFTATYSIPLAALKTSLDFTGTAGTFRSLRVDTDHTKGWGSYWLAGVALPFQVTKSAKLSVGWAYTSGNGYTKAGTDAKQSSGDVRGVATVSCAVTF